MQNPPNARPISNVQLAAQQGSFAANATVPNYAPVNQNNNPATGVARAIPNNTGTGRFYPIPQQFTLTGTNATGGALSYKMQSFDNLVELALQASLGTVQFSVAEIPNIAALATPSASTLTGVDAIRNLLSTYAIFVSYINNSASSTSQLNNALKIYQAGFDGQSFQRPVLVGAYVSNAQYNATLIPMTLNGVITANTAMNMVINANSNVSLTFKTTGFVPYNFVL